jgi:serine/threonine protein kinase
MRIICPHCQNLIDHIESAADEVLCTACGSAFKWDSGSTTGWQPWQGPRRLGRFELLEVVGVGSFGTVYKARDPELDRKVAVKVPRAGHAADGADLQRFQREARSVAQLRHPGIVAVHEVGQAGGVPYLVSDFVEGITLSDLLTSRPPPARSAAALVAEVADALHYAHEQGVVHRGVKSSNIMLETGGVASGSATATGDHSARTAHSSPKLMDFGVAKRDVGDLTVTRTGEVLGTPAFMSPEQARGQSHDVDRRSDVYSLGVVLYQMLTGELPFRGTSQMLLHQVLHDEPRRPRRLNDYIPRDLETICLKAMAKEPARRYATAANFAEDLRRFLRSEPSKARAVGRVERAARCCRRNPVVAGLSAAVLVAFLIGSGGVAWQWREAESNRKEAEHQQGIAESNEQELRQSLERLQEVNRLVQSGRLKTDQGRWPEAEALFLHAAELRPDYSLVWNELGDFYIRLGLWDLADDAVRRAYRLHYPFTGHYWLEAALLHLHQGDRNAYLEVCRAMAGHFQSTAPLEVDGHYARIVLWSPGPDADFRPMIAALEKRTSAPNCVFFDRFLHGVAAYRAGEHALAAQMLREVLADESWVARTVDAPILALAHHRLGQNQEAQRAMALADALHDHWCQLLYEGPVGFAHWPWWDWLEFQLNYREAKTAFTGKPAPDDPRLRVVRARALAALGRSEQAQQDYQAALQAAPNDALLRAVGFRTPPSPDPVRGVAQRKQDQLNAALRSYSDAVALLPDRLSRFGSYKARAEFNERRQAWDKAIEDYTKALESEQDMGEKAKLLTSTKRFSSGL